jgi:hypothetical protein
MRNSDDKSKFLVGILAGIFDPCFGPSGGTIELAPISNLKSPI